MDTKVNSSGQRLRLEMMTDREKGTVASVACQSNRKISHISVRPLKAMYCIWLTQSTLVDGYSLFTRNKKLLKKKVNTLIIPPEVWYNYTNILCFFFLIIIDTSFIGSVSKTY